MSVLVVLKIIIIIKEKLGSLHILWRGDVKKKRRCKTSKRLIIFIENLKKT